MKQKLFIILGLVILVAVLIGLNAASYSQKKKLPDSELFPDRSTYNTGATGTRAFYDLLAETGRKPVRWQETTAELLTAGPNKPATFVVIGDLKNEFTDDEATQLLKWVSAGGKLVIIDRQPPKNLVKTTANWNVFVIPQYRQPVFDTDASDQKQMTAGVKAAKAVQPTVFTKGINGVQTSQFATSFGFEHFGEEDSSIKPTGGGSQANASPTFSTEKEETYQPPPKSFPSPTGSPTPKPLGGGGSGTGSGQGSGRGSGEISEAPPKVKNPVPVIKVKTPEPASRQKVETVALSAPVSHLTVENRNVLVDVSYGSGQIVLLSDPYIVANGGISLVDNAQLAINIVASREGTIAFDEYHHGYGTNKNPLLGFFAGTPVIPIFLQLILLLGLIFFSQSRRFARPVPEPEPDRLSKLEYVSAMAELQQRTKAFDLAIENIYTDFRRRTARLVGVDNFTTPRRDLAQLIAERLPEENPDEIEALMKKCEDIMHGEATNKKEVLRLTSRLREIEERLGLQRRKKVKS